MSVPSLSSDELNLLIYKYLLESGYLHTSFSFSHECILKTYDLTPGLLISLVQKGLQYTDLEMHVSNEESICQTPVSIVPHVCVIKGKRKMEALITLELPEEVNSNAIVTLKGHNSLITTLKYNDYNETIITCDITGICKVWYNNISKNLPNYKQSISSLPISSNNDVLYDVKNRSILTCDNNNNYIIIGTYGSILYIYELPFNSLPRSKNISSSPISMVKLVEISISTDEKDTEKKLETFICVGTMDGIFYLLTVDGKILDERILHRGGILDILYDNINNNIISAGSDGVLSINNIATKEIKNIQEIVAHDKEITSIDIRENYLCSASDDGSCKIFKRTKSDTLQEKYTCIVEKKDHGRGLTNVRVCGDGKYCATSSLDCTVKLYSFPAMSLLYTFSDMLYPVTTIIFSNDHQYLACVSHDKLFVYFLSTGKIYKKHTFVCGIIDICWKKNDTLIVTLSNSNLEVLKIN